MHIDLFVEQMKSATERFAEEYRKHNKAYPTQFPLELEDYEEWVGMLEFVNYAGAGHKSLRIYDLNTRG